MATARKKTTGFLPHHDLVVVQRFDEEEQTEGGLFIPEVAKDPPGRGLVLAVGPGRIAENGRTVLPQAQPGQTVVFNKYSGSEVVIDGASYLVLRDSEILGRIV